MVRECHVPRQPLQNHPSGHLGGWATPWSAEEILDGQRLNSGDPCPCQSCSQRPLAQKTRKGSLLNRPPCPPDDPNCQRTELRWGERNCNRHVAWTENARPSLRSDKRVAAPTCLERSPLSLVYDQLVWPFLWARVHQKELILNCQIKMAVERVVCLVCACRLANRDLSLRCRRHVKYWVRKTESSLQTEEKGNVTTESRMDYTERVGAYVFVTWKEGNGN